MKKITTILFLLLTMVTGMWAQSTVEWNTAPNFKPNDNASVYYVGITTPGTTDASYTMTAFSFYENSGYGAAAAYTVISTTAPTAENGWLVAEEDVLGISNENTTPTGEGFIDYTIAGDEGVVLQGATTYYMVFVTSNETNDGFYQVGTQRVRLQNGTSYPASVCLGNGVVRTDLTAAFKATLTTDDAFDVSYKAFSTADGEMFEFGTVSDIVGQMTVPTFENYQFSHATLPDGTEFDVTQEITENMELYLYYNPLYDIEYVIKNENGEDLISKTILEVYGSTITQLPAELDQSLFYDYSEINFVVDNWKTIEVTATMKKNPLIAFNENESGDLIYNRLKLKGSNYLYFVEDYPNVGLTTEVPEDETSEWAFVGNPYQGFYIKNHAAGSEMVLGSEDPKQDSRTGGDTYATLGEEGTQPYELWIPRASSHATNGFFLFNEGNTALNLRDGKVAYWTGGYDAGSTFVAERILTSEELLADAKTLLEELTAGASDVQIGYPNADALAAFKAAIEAAEKDINEGISDEKTISDNLKAAMAEVKLPANAIYTPRTDVYYTITNARGSMVYDPEHAEDMDADGNEFLWYSNSLDKENANHQWGFIEQNGVYYMYNVGKKQFAGVTTANPGVEGKNFFANGAWMFSNAPSTVTLDAGIEDWVPTPNVRVQATSAVTGDTYAMSISPSYTGPIITYDAKNDGGIPMTFAIAATTQDSEVTAAIEELLNDIAPYKEALEMAITRANEFLSDLAEFPVGDDLNEYTMEGDPEAIRTAIANAEAELANSSATKESLSTAYNALNEAKDAIKLTLNMPQAGMWLRIVAAAHGTMLSAKPVESPANRMAFIDEADGSTVFYFDGSTLTSLDRGLAMTGRDAGKAGVEGVAYSFEESALTPGKYCIRFNPDGASNRFLWAWDSSKGYADQNGADNANCAFILENVKQLPLTMTEQAGGRYLAAISLPTSVATVGGAKVENVFMQDGKAVYEHSNAEGIPANTGVLLAGNEPVATLVLGDCEEGPDNNALQPLLQSSADFTEGLILSSPEGTVGFWEPQIVTIYGDEEQGTEDQDTKPVRGFTAYLDIATAGANGVELVESTNGIENIEHGTLNMDNAPVYNLQGQRVNKAQKGVFIQNGKKVVVK